MRGPVSFSKIKVRLDAKSTDILILTALFLFSLRVINWFEYPYILCSGDLRPPLVQEAFVKRIVYAWDETDFGMPSIYTPKILDLYYLFIIILENLGMNLYYSQMVTVFLMYFLASLLMYIFVKIITNGNIIASLTAALFLTANVFLINDREITAIGFIGTTLMLLPCLITFSKGIKSQSYKLMAVAGMLCVLSYATFPNYRTTLICLMMLCLILLFLGSNNLVQFRIGKEEISIKLNLSPRYLKLLMTFGIAFLLGSIWIFTITFSNLDTLIGTCKELSTPRFVRGREIHFVMRLIARWGFDSGALGMPYIPYKDVYLNDPLIILLSFLPTVMAFGSIISSKERKITIFFGIFAVFFLALTSGFSFVKYGDTIYFDLVSLPLLKSFREAANWIFFVIICYSILIGCAISSLCGILKNRMSKILLLCTVALLFSYISYPLTTGDVTRNWLSPNIKGSYLPDSYAEINNALSDSYWTILFPHRFTYVVYNFSGIPLGCGNPYPLIFSKPIISGCGTEYLRSQSSELINKIYDYAGTDIQYRNIAPEGKASASSNETRELTPDKAIDGNMQTRWSSKIGLPQWFEIEWKDAEEIMKIDIFFGSAYAENYNIDVWNGSNWITILSIKNNTSMRVEHIFLKPIITERLRLFFLRASSFGSVSIWELEVYGKTEVMPKFLGMLGIKYIILEKNIIYGNTTSPIESKLRLHECEDFKLIREWDEMELYENKYALKKVYVADNIIACPSIDDMYKSIGCLEWGILNHSVFLNSSDLNEMLSQKLTMPKNFVWTELSPTRYEARAYASGPFILVLLESYSQNWKVQINGKNIPKVSHFMVNSYANGWLINETGNLTIIIYNEMQDNLTTSVIASVIMPTILLLTLAGNYVAFKKRKIQINVPRFFRKRRKQQITP